MPLLDVDDLFIPEFIETATVSGVAGVEVISSEIDAETMIREIGADVNIDGALVTRATVTVAQDDLVTFRSTEYRVIHVAADSANLTKRIYLQSKYGGGA